MMEHALLNDESESGQVLVGWLAGGMCGAEGGHMLGRPGWERGPFS